MSGRDDNAAQCGNIAGALLLIRLDLETVERGYALAPEAARLLAGAISRVAGCQDAAVTLQRSIEQTEPADWEEAIEQQVRRRTAEADAKAAFFRDKYLDLVTARLAA